MRPKLNIILSLIVGSIFLIWVPKSSHGAPATGLSDTTYRKALEKIQGTQEQFPKTYDGLQSLARTFSNKGDYDRSAEIYSKLLEQSPENVDLLLWRGQVYRNWGRYEESRNDLEEATRIAPEYADVHRALARTYAQSDRHDSAIKSYDRFLELQPDAGRVYLEKANVLAKMGRREDALETLRTAASKGVSRQDIRSIRNDILLPSTDHYWSTGIGYRQTFLHGNQSDWKNPRLRIGHHTEEHTVLFEYDRMGRFDRWNDQYGLDIYHDLWERAHLNATYRRSPQHEFLPRDDARIELFQGFGQGFEGSLNLRTMRFDNLEVDLYGASLGFYRGNWYLRGNLTRSLDTRNTSGLYGQLTTRHYYRGTSDDYWEISVGSGKDQIDESPGRQAVTRTTETFSLFWQRYWTPLWGTELSYDYTGPEDSVTRQTISFMLLRRWPH